MTRLLSIVVPTYNRAAHLALLLDTLAQEDAAVLERIAVVIGDNASTDRTPEVTDTFAARHPGTLVLRHPQNVGPEMNFCLCLDRVETPWFWIFGDDDLPKPGVLATVLRLLQAQRPDLVYLRSEWLPVLHGRDDGTPLAAITPVQVPADRFARDVHIWITFISGMVVHRARLRELAPHGDLRRHVGTSLVQLGWILPLLREDARLWVVPQPCILATSGNSGGYRLVQVFGDHLPRILAQELPAGSALARPILSTLCWWFLPGLLWLSRGSAGRAFVAEDLLGSLGRLRASTAYALVLWPIARLPRALAFPAWAATRVLGRAQQALFRRRYRAPAGAAR